MPVLQAEAKIVSHTPAWLQWPASTLFPGTEFFCAHLEVMRCGKFFSMLRHHFSANQVCFLGTECVLHVCRSDIDKADVEAFRSMLWRAPAAQQASMWNEQRQIAYVNMEYCYLQYCCGLGKSVSASGTQLSFHYDEIMDFGDPVQSAGKEVWPKCLSRVIMGCAYSRSPNMTVQKRFPSSMR